jgi:hypothetical protein
VPAANEYDKPILSSEKILHKDYDRRCAIEKKILTVSLKGFAPKTN